MPAIVTTVIGILGAIFVLGAFVMVQLKRWTAETRHFDLLNFAGSALLVVYGLALQSWPFVVLNAIWALFSLRDLIRHP